MACAAMRPSRPVTSVGFGRASLTRQPKKRKDTAQISFFVSLETSPFTLSLSSFANAAGAKSISPVSALHLSFSLLALASRNLRKGRRQLEGNEQLLDSRWVVLQPAVVGDGASVVELALRQFFPSSRAARVFENGRVEIFRTSPLAGVAAPKYPERAADRRQSAMLTWH